MYIRLMNTRIRKETTKLKRKQILDVDWRKSNYETGFQVEHKVIKKEFRERNEKRIVLLDIHH